MQWENLTQFNNECIFTDMVSQCYVQVRHGPNLPFEDLDEAVHTMSIC